MRPNGLRVTRVRVPARRGRRDLREPAQRDERRRRAVPQGGQRRLPARLVVRPRVQPGRRRAAAPGRRQGRPARGRRGPGGGHLARDGGRVHAAARPHRLPHPAGRPGADRVAARARHRALRPRRRRQLPHLHRRRGRPGHGARPGGQRQDAPLRRVQRRRDDPGARGRGRPSSCRAWPPRWRRPASRSGPTSGCARIVPDAVPATEEDFATEFLGAGGGHRGGRRRRRRHRRTSPATARATPRRSSPPTWRRPTASWPRSTRRRCW